MYVYMYIYTVCTMRGRRGRGRGGDEMGGEKGGEREEEEEEEGEVSNLSLKDLMVCGCPVAVDCGIIAMGLVWCKASVAWQTCGWSWGKVDRVMHHFMECGGGGGPLPPPPHRESMAHIPFSCLRSTTATDSREVYSPADLLTVYSTPGISCCKIPTLISLRYTISPTFTFTLLVLDLWCVGVGGAGHVASVCCVGEAGLAV